VAEPPPAYRGRFAPSPTGPLHFGSLVAALASYLDARAAGGRWLVRIDDIDKPRERPGAATAILGALEALGLEWDERVWFQSEGAERYQAALERLAAAGALFPCACTRRQVGKGPYPGTCRNGLAPGQRARAVRFRVPAGASVAFDDRVQGAQSWQPAASCGDFIVRRADGPFAYHLATVVDDAAQGVTDVVRGADLLASTVPQLLLIDALGAPRPRYAHVATVVDAAGIKLSKQAGAAPIDPGRPVPLLRAALACLGHRPPAALADRAALLEWAVQHWLAAALPRRRELHGGCVERER